MFNLYYFAISVCHFRVLSFLLLYREYVPKINAFIGRLTK